MVMAGLVPAIHVFAIRKAWMPGTRLGMTREDFRLLLLRGLFALFFRADVFQVRAQGVSQPPVPESSWPAMRGPCPQSGRLARAVFGGPGRLPTSRNLLR